MSDVSGQQPQPVATGRASWGLGLIALGCVPFVVLGGAHMVLLFTLADDHTEGIYPLGIPITILLLWSIAHVVVCIVGLIRAGRAVAFRPPAVPFFRV